MLRYSIAALLAVRLNLWGRKAYFTQYRYDANFLYPTPYVYDPSNTNTETKGEI